MGLTVFTATWTTVMIHATDIMARCLIAGRIRLTTSKPMRRGMGTATLAQPITAGAVNTHCLDITVAAVGMLGVVGDITRVPRVGWLSTRSWRMISQG